MQLGMIWAEARGRVIGTGDGMPWHVPEDLAHFKSTTMGHPVIMGRGTWNSIPERFRPFPGRHNIVLTTRSDFSADGAEVVDSLEAAIVAAAEHGDTCWVVGGGSVYEQAIDRADVLEVTHLDIDAEGSVLAPAIGRDWQTVTADPDEGFHVSGKGVPYRFVSYRRA